MENEKQIDIMKTNVTLAGLLGVLSVLVIPMIALVISIETRLTMHGQRIDHLESTTNKIYSKLESLEEKCVNILLEMKDKKDRD